MSDDHYIASYICKGCGAHSFTVRYRRKDENIVAWIEGVVRPAMGEAHLRNAPFCLATNCDLKLPAPDGTGIGMRVEH